MPLRRVCVRRQLCGLVCHGRAYTRTYTNDAKTVNPALLCAEVRRFWL